ncbi:hypothetical protein V5O48_007722 [Marasmius crinis-equi]|uniref:Protein kinase domain-containing protein n=1 Tax=Marasmius crinis-equi TaxID=585013 RepID=A0ABR3FG17_9AGAR
MSTFTGPKREELSDVLQRKLVILETSLEDHTKRQDLTQIRGDEAQKTLDLLQLLADLPDPTPSPRSHVLKIMSRLSRESRRFPRCLVIKNVELLGKRPFGCGAFGDVYRGKVGDAATSQADCAVKVVRRAYFNPNEDDQDPDYKNILGNHVREAIIWRQLKHSSVLPFLGIYFLDDNWEDVCLVSPYMPNGNLAQFLRKTEPVQVDSPTLISDIALGLEYLHNEDIVHGDLKDLNILLTEAHRACICDFGLSRVGVTLGLPSSTYRGGTLGYMAPEVLRGGLSVKESDIYSVGVLFFMILKKVYDLPKDVPRGGGDQPRPTNLPEEKNYLWSLIQHCWMEERSARPTAKDIVKRVTSMNDIIPAPNWDLSLYSSIRNNIDFHPLLASACELSQHEEGESPPPSSLVADLKASTASDQSLQSPVDAYSAPAFGITHSSDHKSHAELRVGLPSQVSQTPPSLADMDVDIDDSADGEFEGTNLVKEEHVGLVMQLDQEIFTPPEDPPTPSPDPAARRRRSSGPLVGERQEWAYPIDLSGTGLAYPVHSTPYGAYTPLPPYAPASTYTPYALQRPPFTPHSSPASLYPPFQPLHSAQRYPSLYATPIPFLASTIRNRPRLPLTSQLPTHTLPANTPLNAATIPLSPPQPESIISHPAIFALEGGLTCLDWDVLFPPTPEYAKLVNPPTPRIDPELSEPAFKTGFVVSQLSLRTSTYLVLAYWMDIWGPLTFSEIPTVQGLLEAIHQYLHKPLTTVELDNLLSTPGNKENVIHVLRTRFRDGRDLGLKEGFKRLDVLGSHRKFAGVWIDAIELDERGETLEIEIMVGLRPNGLRMSIREGC